MTLPPAPGASSRGLRRLGLAVSLLLGADLLLAWAVLQGAHAFLELAWLALARRPLPPGGFEAHAAQFRALRWAEAGAWGLTALACAAWLRRARAALVARGEAPPENVPALGRPLALIGALARAARPPGSALAWWWGALFIAAALGHLAVVALALAGRPALDLGGPLQLLAAAELAGIAAAVVAIALVRRITGTVDPPAPWR